MTKTATAGTISIRSRLVGLVLVAIVPVIIFAIGLAYFLTNRQKTSIEEGLQGTAQALSMAIDHQIHQVVSAVTLLVNTEAFPDEEDEYRKLHLKLRKAIATQPGWVALSYALPSGEQLFNTSTEYGFNLPSWNAEPFFQQARSSGHPVVSGFRYGMVTKRKNISVAIPVLKDGRVRYILVAGLDLTIFSQTLKDQKFHHDWVAAIIDGNQKIVARSRSQDETSGRSATPKLGEKIRENVRGSFEDKTLEGVPSFGVYSRSQYTGWTVVVAMPRSEANKSIKNSIVFILIGGVLLVGLGILAAYVMGAKISEPILNLAEEAARVDEGEEPFTIVTSVKEVQEVSLSLKKAVLEKNENLRRAQEAIKIRETFLSVASHELKTPLTALILNLNIMERSLKAGEVEKLSGLIHRAVAQSTRLAQLIDELLDVTKISSGKIAYNFELVNLRFLLMDILQQFPETTLEMDGDVTGEWDPSRLEQIITNLLSNAQKYGKGQPILMKVTTTPDEVHVAVIDQGIGIEVKDQRRVFERFERAVDSNLISGLGLGLWISQQMALGHGGRIDLRSEIGKGSTFILILPLKQQAS